MRYDVAVAATSLEPLRATAAALTEAMKPIGAVAAVADSHNAGATMTIEAHDLAEAIDIAVGAWLAALRATRDGASAMSVSAARAE
jgi:hypothetical protein